jgi:hypothetical protein
LQVQAAAHSDPDMKAIKYFLGSSNDDTPLYTPLDKSRSEIRLLELYHSNGQDDIVQCRLVNTPLGTRIPYIALSYVWGNPKITRDIVVNHQTIQATSNLASALKHIRAKNWVNIAFWYQRASYRLWVDAICINQNDTQERNAQVSLMWKIYNGASHVLAWLGDPNKEMLLAMRIFARFEENLKRSGETDMEWLQDAPELWRKDIIKASGNEQWVALRQFFNNPYWKRIWIIQELLANETLLMIGDECLDWSALNATLSGFINMYKGTVRRPRSISDEEWHYLIVTGFGLHWQPVNLIRGSRFKVKAGVKESLFDHFFHTMSYLATDPRDKIFALLGCYSSNIVPDYTKSVGDVYCEMAREWVNYGKNLDVLVFSCLDPGQVNAPRLPSWVPNWQIISETQETRSIWASINHHIFAADRGMEQKDAFVISDNVLVVNGAICDRVSAIEPRYPSGSSPDDLSDFVLSLIMRSSRPAGIDRDSFFRLFRTLFMDEHFDTQKHQAAKYEMIAIDRLTQERLEVVAGHLLGRSLQKLYERSTTDAANLQKAPFFVREIVLGVRQRVLSDPDAHNWILEPIATLHLKLMRGQVFHTARGEFGLGRGNVEPNDAIYVLKKCHVPVILRKVDSHYIHVGVGFVSGLMNGEAAQMIEDNVVATQELEIH